MPKILIVDDIDDLRSLIQQTFISLGKGAYDILEADNGMLALDIIASERPDLVLLDIMLPGMIDGFGVLNKIKTNPTLKDIRVILVSAKGKDSDAERGMVRGADLYFIKPFSPSQLFDAVEELLNQ